MTKSKGGKARLQKGTCSNPVKCLRMLKVDNGNDHRAAAKDIVSKSRAARGSRLAAPRASYCYPAFADCKVSANRAELRVQPYEPVFGQEFCAFTQYIGG